MSANVTVTSLADPLSVTVSGMGVPGPPGPPGADGAGVPNGGTTGQVLGKLSDVDQDVDWIDQTGGGSGGIPEAPIDGTLYGRKDAGWASAEEAGAAATAAGAVQGNLDTHIADTGNPHGVTAAQVGADPTGSAAAVQGNLSTHIADTGNPHGVTAAQAGADPTGSAAAVQTNLSTHEARVDNPHGVTAAQVGADPAGTTATHEARTDNPHGVTAAQAGADPAGTTATHEARQDNPHNVTAAQVGSPTTAAFNTLDGEVVKSTPIRFIKVNDVGTDADTLYIDTA